MSRSFRCARSLLATLLAAALQLPATAIAQQSLPWAAALDSVVAAEMARTKTPGVQVAVVIDGKLAYSKGYGVADVESGRAVTPRTLFRVGSVTKMITAATLMQIVADGKLDLQK